ncbi:hypothetical protein [Motiliproteus sp. SC1-56]|uniref:hypothetical protein n=1 Tax=Motiliproteus sp. SC1-56 TaxID=2799565 RepID=UPI001A8F1CBC|nr:hypothetical protein [Motiliproteus sp. SC1-56]
MGEYTSNGAKLGTCGCQYATRDEVWRIVTWEVAKGKRSEAHDNFHDPSTLYRFPFDWEDTSHLRSLEEVEAALGQRTMDKGLVIPVDQAFVDSIDHKEVLVRLDERTKKPVHQPCTKPLQVEILYEAWRDMLPRTVLNCGG